MLQTDKSSSALGRDFGLAEIASPSEMFGSFAAFVRRQLPVILFVLLLTIVLGAVYLFTTPPRFTGEAVMIIDSRRAQLFQQSSVMNDLTIDSATVESQVEVLKSENIALAIIKDLRLADDPEFTNPGGGLVGTLLGLVSGLFDSGAETSEFEQTRRALGEFQRRLTVKRIGLTYVIEIKFQSLNPDRAAQVANAVADSYVIDQLDAKFQSSKRASVWLQERIRELREQASGAERAVVEFKAKHDIVDTGGRLLGEQQLAELNSQLILARAYTAETRARLDRIEGITRASAEMPDATVADTLKNEVISKLRTQYLDLARREADWSGRYGATHLAAVNLRNQMIEIRRSIVDELRRTAETFKSDYEIAKQREEAIQTGLSQVVSTSQTTNRAQILLRELESTAQTYRALHDNFLQRYMESVQQQSFPITEARLITKASRPLNKSSPKALLILAVATAGGGILGLGMGMLRDFWDRVFRTSRQVETELQAECLAVLPLIKGNPPKRSPSERAMSLSGTRTIISDSLSGTRTIISDEAMVRHVIDQPLSRFAESMRAIKVAADLNRLGKSNKVIGITSSLPNEGKSTIAASLAYLMAHAGAKTILVDCDLRNPSITRLLSSKAKIGVLDVLSGSVPLKDAVWTDRATNLTFLPAVVRHRMVHSNEILASQGMKDLFERLRESYEYVIVDLSPLAPVVDVRSTGHLVDSYVFVIEWGRTRIELVKHSLSEARAVYENLLGVVLNKADVRVLARYEGYRESYYYNKSYARYGYTN